jgi:hypothetical protein
VLGRSASSNAAVMLLWARRNPGRWCGRFALTPGSHRSLERDSAVGRFHFDVVRVDFGAPSERFLDLPLNFRRADPRLEFGQVGDPFASGNSVQARFESDRAVLDDYLDLFPAW